MSKTNPPAPKNKKRFCWTKLLLVGMALFVSLQLVQQYQRYQQIQAEAARQREQLELAQANYDALREQVRLLYRDSYLEQLARGSLGMIKAGEVIVSPAEISDVPEVSGAVNEKDVFH